MLIDELHAIVAKAIAQFNIQEKYLIEQDLSERCICARFAMHLTQAIQNTEYRNYLVDVEYNRGADGSERAIKRIDDAPITVDLIVHKRGFDCLYGFDNLICMEMKKSRNRKGCSSDEDRLRKLTDMAFGFCHKLGAMILVDSRDRQLKIQSLFCAGQKMTEVVAALIWDGDRFMICQRPAHKARGLLWEFVGGKVEPGETKEQALIRECQEELAITLDVGEVFMDVVHEYPDLTVHLTLFHATIREGIPQKLEHNDIRWITVDEIDQYAFCPADVEILRRLKDAR